MALSLTNSDVLILLQQGSVDAKLEIADRICADYAQAKYSKEELGIAEEIFRLMAKDAEVRVRSTLSSALKNCNFMPHDLAIALARDVEEVSIPLIEYSEILTEEDLDEIVGSGKVQKVLAISRRQKLSKEMRNKLLKSGFDTVIEAVCANDNIGPKTEAEFSEMIESFAHDKQIVFKIIKNSTLSLKLTEKLMTETARKLVEEVKIKYGFNQGKLDSVASHATEISLLSVIDHHSRSADIEFLVDHLSFQGKLTNSIVLSALCMGRRRFFITAIATRAGIAKRNAIVLMKGGRDGFRSLLAKAGLPEKLFDAIELVMRLTEEKKRHNREISVGDFCNWLILKLEYFAERSRIEYLAYLMAIAKQTQPQSSAA